MPLQDPHDPLDTVAFDESAGELAAILSVAGLAGLIPDGDLAAILSVAGLAGLIPDGDIPVRGA